MSKERTNFIAKWKRYQVWKDGEKLAQFEDIGGGYGGFNTNDEELINKLKSIGSFGQHFFCLEDEGKLPNFYRTNTHVGPMTSLHREVDEEKLKANAKAEAQLEAARRLAELKPKIKKLGELEGKWLKNDGDFRADAPDDVKVEYNKLKQEIGEI